MKYILLILMLLASPAQSREELYADSNGKVNLGDWINNDFLLDYSSGKLLYGDRETGIIYDKTQNGSPTGLLVPLDGEFDDE